MRILGLVLIAMVFTSCALADAFVPNELSLGYYKGKIHGKEWRDHYGPHVNEPDQTQYFFGGELTWHLRKENRELLRAILRELKREDPKE